MVYDICLLCQMQDNASDFDKDEIECAIALSLSEADEKGKKVIGEFHYYCNFGEL